MEKATIHTILTKKKRHNHETKKTPTDLPPAPPPTRGCIFFFHLFLVLQCFLISASLLLFELLDNWNLAHRQRHRPPCQRTALAQHPQVSGPSVVSAACGHDRALAFGARETSHVQRCLDLPPTCRTPSVPRIAAGSSIHSKMAIVGLAVTLAQDLAKFLTADFTFTCVSSPEEDVAFTHPVRAKASRGF